MHEITLLYFDDCPSWKTGLDNLNSAILAEDIEANVTLLRIENSDDARIERFLGSPSFRVNGIDLWPEERDDFELSCRIYNTPDGMKGFPSVEMLREKLRTVFF